MIHTQLIIASLIRRTLGLLPRCRIIRSLIHLSQSCVVSCSSSPHISSNCIPHTFHASDSASVSRSLRLYYVTNRGRGAGYIHECSTHVPARPPVCVLGTRRSRVFSQTLPNPIAEALALGLIRPVGNGKFAARRKVIGVALFSDDGVVSGEG